MFRIDDRLLAQVQGAASLFEPQVILKTIEEMFPGKIAPYAEWTTWGSKTHGQPPPRYGDSSGIKYTFWGRPARNALVVSGPRF